MRGRANRTGESRQPKLEAESICNPRQLSMDPQESRRDVVSAGQARTEA